jgi:hypothetical protein
MVPTTDVTALCARYKEALEMIAKGGENPTELALLAYAALYNQPPVETAVEEKIARLSSAVALLNSMVLSGESHSDVSRQVVRDALT